MPNTHSDISANASASPAVNWAARARVAYDAMVATFAVPRLFRRSILLREMVPTRSGPHYASVWPYSQALAATIDMVELARAILGDTQGEGAGTRHDYARDLDDRLKGLARYWDARPAFGLPGYETGPLPPVGNGGDKYYDDNAWIALELLRVYAVTRAAEALARATAVFQFLVTGWAGDTGDGSPPGGLYWKVQKPGETSHGRHTCSTAPSAEVALRLYAVTGDASYLDWARRMYAWVNAALRDEDEMYRDNIAPGPRIDATKWSYNQGTMLGASALLAEATGEAHYLAQAEAIAAAALRYYGYRDGALAPDALLFRQDAIFNTLLYRNLLLVSRQRPHLEYRAAFAAYAEAIWSDPARCRRMADGPLFTLHVEHPERVTLLDQAALVSLAALLAMGQRA